MQSRPFCTGPLCFLKFHYQYIPRLILFQHNKAMSPKSLGGIYLFHLLVYYLRPHFAESILQTHMGKASVKARLPQESGGPQSHTIQCIMNNCHLQIPTRQGPARVGRKHGVKPKIKKVDQPNLITRDA